MENKIFEAYHRGANPTRLDERTAKYQVYSIKQKEQTTGVPAGMFEVQVKNKHGVIYNVEVDQLLDSTFSSDKLGNLYINIPGMN